MKVLSSTNILMSQGPRLPFQALPKAQKKKVIQKCIGNEACGATDFH